MGAMTPNVTCFFCNGDAHKLPTQTFQLLIAYIVIQNKQFFFLSKLNVEKKLVVLHFIGRKSKPQAKST